MRLVDCIRRGPGQTISLLIFVGIFSGFLLQAFQLNTAQAQSDDFVITGEVLDTQGQAIAGAEVSLIPAGSEERARSCLIILESLARPFRPDFASARRTWNGRMRGKPADAGARSRA